MLRYKVLDSFWANDASVNWNTDEFGYEGVGIPRSLVQKAIRAKMKLEILIEKRGAIYQISPLKVREHDKKWKTQKTAPRGAKNIFMMIPVRMMEFSRLTRAEEARQEEMRKRAEERERVREMQQTLF